VTELCRRFLEEAGAWIESTPRGYAGLRGASLPYGLAAYLSRRQGAKSSERVVIVTPSDEAASRLREALLALLGESSAPVLLPPCDVDPYDAIPPHSGLLLERSMALGRLLHFGRAPLLLSAESLLWKVPRRGWWSQNQIFLEPGAALDPRTFRRKLWQIGYRKADLVNAPGEFSSRGNLVDIFLPQEALPVRAELFGEEVENLRFFDVSSQRSLSQVGRSVWVPPLFEAIRDEALLGAHRKLLDGLGAFGEERLKSLDAVGSTHTFDVEARVHEEFFCPLPDFLGPATWVASSPEAIAAAGDERERFWSDSFKSHGRPEAFAPSRLFWGKEALASLLASPGCLRIGESPAGIESERPPVFPGEPMRLMAYLGERAKEGFRVLLLFNGKGTLDRAREMARDAGLEPLVEPPPEGAMPPGIYLAVAPASEGVSLPQARLMALCEKEIFGRPRPASAPAARREAFFSQLRDLKIGDAVVHSDHGVARYAGIETLVRDGAREDFLALSYAGGDKLLVPVQRLDLIQKYVGPEGHEPALDRLGGQSWKKRSERVRKAVREIAHDLLQLYARRQTAKAVAVAPDGVWQAEFEAAFPYELTPDQQRAIDEVKKDLESDKPADRIICGDVGFGKTEVALRAAFKVAADGGQVAVLCPTTVLAMQHYERFTERFAPFPFRVAMLSRFVTPKEQKAVIKDANQGLVDVLIGTHRILSKDVVLPNLRLMIVDEEQRFGVAHKEKIKQAKHEVHALTLTATPIPRTLQMGLSNLLEMSLIQTPPKDRLAIETRVLPYDEGLAAWAVRRELARQGQVFYVHNRVESIAASAARLREIVPEARIAVAHGQMRERDLEEIMMAFVHGRYDVLCSTTIIENGMDLPRANTLIVENAQDFGLCQLYQLRGRIGRSDVPAYAFLLTPKGTIPTGDAARRLEALEEFAELGAGFRIAAADLEQRGAGTLLGARQSGHMASVGFELYMRLLEEAVAEARGEVRGPKVRCDFNLGLDLSVPLEYMEEVNQRLAFYRELSLAASEDEVDRIAAANEDRFGPLPGGVLALLQAAKLKLRAERCQVRKVTRKGDVLLMKFEPDAILDIRGLLQFAASRPKVRLEPSGSLEMVILPGEGPLEAISKVLDAARPGPA
jgi:transcription-repair coupling factor (superfamily II helicase)